MDRYRSSPARLFFTVCLFWLSGCGWGSAPPDNSVEEDVADAADDPPIVAPATALPAASQATSGRPLKAGDRFPLLKTVTQTLQQPSPNGWVTSRSTLEMLMSVTVEEIHPLDGRPQGLDPRSGQKRLQVNYHRVRFSQDLPGQPRLEYDSNVPTSPVPQAALGYHGLKDNGFGFWTGSDNQIVELAAFDQFVSRCFNDVPVARRQQAAAAMVLPAAEAIACFVDDTVGVLPATAVREGDCWVRDREVLQPVPLHVSNKCTVRRMTPELAQIEILGIISAPTPNSSIHQPGSTARVVVRGGKSQGDCLVDRRTGLPVESRAEQSLEMTVRMPDGSEFDQQKSTLTTIQSVPDSSPPPRVAQGADDTAR
ncbi:MAG: DUF6263 family protein [Deltaproteobacteria bacterium]